MKKFLCIFILFVLVLSLTVGCSKTVKLDTPQGLVLDGGTLFWNKVENAEGYQLDVNGEIQNVPYNWCELALQNGKSYVIKVKALGSGKYTDSDFSAPYERSASGSSTLQKLSSPEIREINGLGVMRWSMISNADGYKIFKNNVLYATVQGATVTTYTLDITEPGSYSMQVQAFGNSGLYADSNKSNVYKLVIGGDGKPRLPAITAPTIDYDADSESLTWVKINNAVKYSIFLNDNLIDETETLSYKISPNLKSNEYYVVANGDGITYGNSKSSNRIAFPLSPVSPTSLRIDTVDGSTAVVWDGVKYSRGYRIEINGTVSTCMTPYFKFSGYPDGEYEFRVYTLGDDFFYSSSLYSESISVNVKGGVIVKPRIDTPRILYYVNSTRTLSWSQVENARAYKVLVETPYDDALSTFEFETVDLDYTLDEVFENVDLVFYVKALAVDGFEDSLYSAGFAYAYTRSYDLVSENNTVVHVDMDEYSFLSAPLDVSYGNGSFSWYSKDGQGKFLLYVDQNVYQVEGNTYDYQLTKTITVSVEAVSEKEFCYSSPRSEEKIFVYPKRLDTPTIGVTGYDLTITPVENASSYVVNYNGESFETALNVIPLKEYLTIDGNYVIYVTAISDDDSFRSSLKSAELSFTVDYGEWGTKEKPFEIATKENLALLKEDPQAYYSVVSDLDFEGQELTPIFTDDYFYGHLLGNGKTFKNFKISPVGGHGSFLGKISNAEISDLNFENVEIVGGSYLGILATIATESTIKGVSVKGKLSSVDVSFAGGLVAVMSGEISSCFADITAELSGSRATIGALVGEGAGTISLTEVNSYMTISSANKVGGLAGSFDGTSTQCIIDSTITVGSNSRVGLVCGSANGSFAFTANGTLNVVSGYAGAFGSLNGSVKGSVDISIIADGDGTLYVGGLSGLASLDEAEVQVSAKINLNDQKVYFGSLVGRSQTPYSYNGDITLDLTAKINEGYVGGINGEGDVDYTGNIDGNIQVDAKSSFGSLSLGSVVGTDDDMFLATAVTVSGGVTSYYDRKPNGEGTQTSPYLLNSAIDFLYIDKEPSAYYLLNDDVSLALTRPLSSETAFSGVLDGDGHTITGLNITADNSALFAKTQNATIKNLYLKDCRFTGNVKVASLIAEGTNTQIENVSVDAKINSLADGVAGGLVAISDNCTFTKVGFKGEIVAPDAQVGGLVCSLSGSISQGFAIGKITADIGGGLVCSSTGSIADSYSSVVEYLSNAFAGFVYENNGSITGCYSASEISSHAIPFANGDVQNSKIVKPTFTSLNVETISFDDAKNGVFVGSTWQNDDGFSLIKGLPFQTVENNVVLEDVEIYDSLEMDVSILNLKSFNYFGVAKVETSEGLSLQDGKFVATNYGDYLLTLTFVDKRVQTTISFKETVDPDFPNGKGTASDPYLIETLEQFYKTADRDGVYFKLTLDLDRPDTLDSFSSTIDFNDKNIITDKPLFLSANGASFKSLNLSLDYDGDSACLVKNADSCAFENMTLTLSGSVDKENVGGIAETSLNCTFENITIKGSIMGKAKNFGALTAKGIGAGESSIDGVNLDEFDFEIDGLYVGSIAGVFEGNVYNVTGKLSAKITNALYAGGLVGELRGSVDNTTVQVTLDATADYVGGAVGNLTVDGQKISVSGQTTAENGLYIGGVFGRAVNCQDIEFSGTLTATNCTYTGGLVGYVDSLSGTFDGEISIEGNTQNLFVGGASASAQTVKADVIAQINVGYSFKDGNVSVGGVTGEGLAQDSTYVGKIDYKQTAEKGESSSFIGGIVGDGQESSCVFDGEINVETANNLVFAGGLVGKGTLSGGEAKGSIKMELHDDDITFGGSAVGFTTADILDDVILDVQIVADVTNGKIGYKLDE